MQKRVVEKKKSNVNAKDKTINTKDSLPSYERRNSDVNPEDIRVVAVLNGVYTPSNTKSPCDKYACMAEIFIEDIVERGRTYHGSIEMGQNVIVFFPMTLENTQKAFSRKDMIQFPGLKQGNHFIADINGNALFDKSATNFPTIISYQLIE